MCIHGQLIYAGPSGEAIEEWLRSEDSRTALLQQAGALADDDTLSALRAAIYAERERSEVAGAEAP